MVDRKFRFAYYYFFNKIGKISKSEFRNIASSYFINAQSFVAKLKKEADNDG